MGNVRSFWNRKCSFNIHVCFEIVQDNVTRTLQNLVTEIGRIHKTRTGKAMSRAQKEESTALQILTAEYLREKGAPKVCD